MPPTPTPLTLDAERVLALAAQSMFETFASTAMGTIVVDSAHRIVWIDDGYRRFLPALGHAEGDFPLSEAAARRVMSLPMHPYLTEVQQAQVVDALAQAVA